MSPRPRGRPLRGPEKDTTPINDRIRAREVRLVDQDGAQVGIISKEEALKRAEAAELDLVMVSPGQDGVPVCRILNYSKHRYEEQRRQREARHKQAQARQEMKTVQFKIKIGEHDYDFKRRNAIKFLQHGDRVQAQIFFRGREQQHPELGIKILERLINDVADYGRPVANTTPKQEGRTINIIIEPLPQRQGQPSASDSAPQAADAASPAPAAQAPAKAKPARSPHGLPPELADEI